MQKPVFQAVTPESAGIPSEALERFYGEIQTLKMPLHSFLLLRRGMLVTEGYWSPHTPDERHILYSVSKSITSLAVGFCIDEGRFHLTDKIVALLADTIDYHIDDFTNKMTVRNLLTMCSGHPAATDRTGRDWVRTYLQTPPPYPPGTLFSYDSMATHTLCAIIQNTTGMKLMEYLKPRLFDPLGIEGAYCLEDPKGIAAGSRGIHCKTRDMAKLGQLFLQKGIFAGRQVVPARYLEEATKKQVDTASHNSNIDGNAGYGYQFWRFRGDAYGCRGIGGQLIIVIPSLDVVWVSTGNLLDDEGSDDLVIRLFWSMIAPFISPLPLPENPQAYARLIALTQDLSLPMPNGKTEGELLQLLPGKTYRFAPNEAKLWSILFSKEEDGLGLTLQFAAESLCIHAGLGKWVAQYFAFTDDEGWARCVLADEHTLVCHVHMAHKLGTYKLVLHVDEQLTLRLWSVGWSDFRRLELFAAATQEQ